MNFSAVDYQRLSYYARQHHARFKSYVEVHGVTCQACGGYGGEVEPILDDGTGPWHECGYCEGVGMTTRRIRGLWLTHQRQAKREHRA